MYVGLKQPRGDGERCVTPARAAAKETMFHPKIKLYYTQTKKTVNTENISGMFIVTTGKVENLHAHVNRNLQHANPNLHVL